MDKRKFDDAEESIRFDRKRDKYSEKETRRAQRKEKAKTKTQWQDEWGVGQMKAFVNIAILAAPAMIATNLVYGMVMQLIATMWPLDKRGRNVPLVSRETIEKMMLDKRFDLWYPPILLENLIRK